MHQATRLIAVALLISFVGGALPASAAPVRPSEPPVVQPAPAVSYPGIQGVVEGADYTPALADLAAGSGAKWWREYLSWRDIEPVDAGGDPTKMQWAKFDAKIGEFTKRGMRPVLNLLNPPAWVMGGNPDCGPYPNEASLAKWVRFSKLAAQRYSAAPYNVTHFMIYNEPDTLPNTPEALQGGCWGKDPKAFGALLNVTSTTIKSVNPKAIIIFGAMAFENFIDQGGVYPRDFLDRVITEGNAGNSFDMVAFNSYFYFRQNWEANGPNLIGKAQSIRGILARHGLKKPLVVAELGMLVGGAPPVYPDPGTDADMANYVGQVLTSALADRGRTEGDGIAIALWFTLRDTGDKSWEGADFGLSTINGTPKPAYKAYQAWSAMLAGARLVRNESERTFGTLPAGSPARVCRTGQPFLCDTLARYVFGTPSGNELHVSWIDSGSPANNRTSATRQLLLPASRIDSIRDQFGAAVPYATFGDTVRVIVGQQPLFITMRPAGSASVNATTGGSVTFDNNGTTSTILVPAGAFTETVTLNVYTTNGGPSGPNQSVVGGFVIQAMTGSGESLTSMQKTILVTIGYLQSDLGSTDEQSLKLYRYDEQSETWKPQSTSIDATNNTASATVANTGRYALIGQSYRVTVPATFDGGSAVG